MALASPELEILGWIVSFGANFGVRPPAHIVTRLDILQVIPIYPPLSKWQIAAQVPVFERVGRIYSANIFKIYQAVEREIESNPAARARFPNFNANIKPVLAKGAHGPLAGELHSAKYFHGRSVGVRAADAACMLVLTRVIPQRWLERHLGHPPGPERTGCNATEQGASAFDDLRAPWPRSRT